MTGPVFEPDELTPHENAASFESVRQIAFLLLIFVYSDITMLQIFLSP